MKIRKATGTAAISLATMLLFGACGTGGDDGATPPGGSTDGSESASADGGSDTGAGAIYAEMSTWDACEVVGDSYNAMIEALRAARPDEELSSSARSDQLMCSSDVVWTVDPNSDAGNAGGLVSISLIPTESEEDATARFAELVEADRELFKSETATSEAAEKEITGWDEGMLLFGGLGVGDTFFAVVRDGSYLISIGLETGSNLVAGGPGLLADFTVEEARDQIIDVTLPAVQSAVTQRLEEAGVSSGE